MADPEPARPGVVGALEGLCRTAATELPLLGAVVSLMPSASAHAIAAASSPPVRLLEDAQFGVGEGPTRDAFLARRPVLVADLAAAGVARWPVWTPRALAAGAHEVHALPLHVGATIFGVLTLYVCADGALTPDGLRTAVVLAETATEVLLDGSLPGGGDRLEPVLDATLHTHAHVYQAQGMVMVELGVSLPEALALMRSHAWANGQDLTTLAGEIVAGRTMIPRDDR